MYNNIAKKYGACDTSVVILMCSKITGTQCLFMCFSTMYQFMPTNANLLWSYTNYYYTLFCIHNKRKKRN